MDNNIKLIDGTYSPDEAAEILFSVVNDKIKFHNIQINSAIERNISDTFHSEKRLAELAISKEKISEMLKEARTNNANLEISANIELTLSVKESEKAVV